MTVFIAREVKKKRRKEGKRELQNWEAELGSHWSSRTMDGSLLAPLMNSSRDNLPI